jgi:hypothetical protein
MSRDIRIIPNRLTSATGSEPYIEFSGLSASSIKLVVLDDGSVQFIGDSGGLFGLYDDLSGLLLGINDISGIPVFEVYADNRIIAGEYNTNAFVIDATKIGIGTASPAEVLTISSTQSGLLMSRLTTTQRNDIQSPSNGLIIYNTDESQFNFYNGSTWSEIGDTIDTINGLTMSSNTIKLGGLLTENTIIDLDGSNSLNIGTTQSNLTIGYYFGDPYVVLSTDGENYTKPYFYADKDYAQMSQSSGLDFFGFNLIPDTTFNSYTNGISIKLNDTNSLIGEDVDQPAIIVGSRNSTVNAGVKNSVIIGGSNSVASESNTVYVPNLVILDSLYTTQTSTLSITGSNTIYTISATSYDGVFFDYVLKDGTNYRGGNVTAVWVGTSSVQYSETSTNDIGDTTGVTFSVEIVGNNIEFKADTSSAPWTLKTMIRSI